jgi:hypothetical protein
MIRGVPKYAYVLALGSSALTFCLIMVTLLRSEIPRAQGLVTPLIGAALLGGVFGFVWPSGRPWLWGVLVSSVFWAYFGIVFVALLSTAEPDWMTLVIATSTFGVGWLGAWTGRSAALALGRNARRL